MGRIQLLSSEVIISYNNSERYLYDKCICMCSSVFSMVVWRGWFCLKLLVRGPPSSHSHSFFTEILFSAKSVPITVQKMSETGYWGDRSYFKLKRNEMKKKWPKKIHKRKKTKGSSSISKVKKNNTMHRFVQTNRETPIITLI